MTKLTKENKDNGSLSSRQLAEIIVAACSDAKGKDITVLDVSKIFSEADYFICVSGRSDRQVQGISMKIMDTLNTLGIHPYSREGLEEGQWVLLDFTDVVVHVFYEQTREHYDIESLWTRAPKWHVPELPQGVVFELRAA